METTIKCLKTLFNDGKCFTKGEYYTVKGYVTTSAGLMDAITTNDQGQPHIIGMWWRNFKLV